ncbi:M20/M25/M40 family metallo-hydrolase [Spirillospora sp. NBC_00431]
MNAANESNPSSSIDRRTVLGGVAAAGAGAFVGSAGLAGPADASGPSTRGVSQHAIDRITAQLEGDLIQVRRAIHRRPELAGREEHTAALVAERLRRAGLRPEFKGGHGVVALLEGRYPGRTIAYRADMDAVPPEGQLEPRAAAREAAHHCGHDLHTAIGVGIAEVLARLRERLHGDVLFLFQPAEEALTGAQAMIKDRVLDEPHRPDEIYALHCFSFPSGTMGIFPGGGLAGQDEFTIPLSGPDAATRAARLAERITALGTVQTPRSAAGVEEMVEWMLRPDSPLAEFVYARARAETGKDGAVTVKGSYRCWPEPRWTSLRAEIRGLAAAEDAGVPAFPSEPFPAMINDPRLSELASRHFRRSLGPRRVLPNYACYPFGGEDFTWFLKEVPGAMFWLGIRPEGGGIWEALPHSTTFTPDERAIGAGVRAMAGLLSDRAARRR